jgi:hypothetical protein
MSELYCLTGIKDQASHLRPKDWTSWRKRVLIQSDDELVCSNAHGDAVIIDQALP